MSTLNMDQAPRSEVADDRSPAVDVSDHVFLIACGQDLNGAKQSSDHATAKEMGFKAYNLMRMSRLGLNVPPAFVLGTHYCIHFLDQGSTATTEPGLWQTPLRQLEASTSLGLGNLRNPLLLSVRSGAPVSMPGMLSTVLNIGLCDRTLPGVVALTGNPRLAWDAYRRLVASYGEVVANVSQDLFDQELARVVGGQDEHDLDFAQLRELTHGYLRVFREATGTTFPQDPYEQLQRAIDAVFSSWQSPRAREYRRMNKVDDRIGTAVTVQTMVFGNAGGLSGSGVGFTRDPVSGEAAPWVDFLFNAQGEDVVSGRRCAHGHNDLQSTLPQVWQELVASTEQLERSFGDMQEFEFTVQEGRLFLLQTRNGKRSPRAAAEVALDLLDQGIIDRAEARLRTEKLDTSALTQQRIVAENGHPLTPVASAASASAGVVSGEIALDEEHARARHAAGQKVILVRRDADTGDIAALEFSAGLLTERGARTSHAAVVARQLGVVCLTGCQELHIDEAKRTISFGELRLAEGDMLTLDGNQGLIYPGSIRVTSECPTELLERLEQLRVGS